MGSVVRVAASLILLSGGLALAGDWQIEKVDQSGVGKFSSMKADKDGNLHVVFTANDIVKYGFWDHNLKRWFLMPISANGSTCSLTLDSAQHPHIAFADAGSMPGSKLRYAHWDGKAWKVQAVPLNADIIAYYVSIVLDDNDQPRISYYEYTGPKGTDLRVRMRVVRWNGQLWEVETVDGQNQSGTCNALGIDGQGHLHLAYANVNGMTAGMRFGFWDGNEWKLEILEGLPSSQTYLGYSVCLVMDKEGNPHISYSHYSDPFLVKYATRKGGKWRIEVADRLVNVGYPDRNAIALDEDSQPYLSYFDAGQGTLKVAHREGGKWVAETVDSNGAGFTSSIQIDRGVLWVGYADESGNGFKVAHRSITAGKAPLPYVPATSAAKK